MNRDQLQRYGYSVHALRAEARKRLPRMLFDMVDGAAGDEITVKRNVSDIAELQIVPKLLTGAPVRNQSVEICSGRMPNSARRGPPIASAPSIRRAMLRPPPSRRSAPQRLAPNGCRCFSTRTVR
jgi:hypothetical protein